MKNAKNNFKDIFKKGDLILLFVLIVAVVLTIVFATQSGDNYVEIYVDGVLKYQLDINSNTEISLLDGKMTVVVSDGEVWIKESDCAEQLCVQSSHINSNGGMIVCLPNKVVVKVVAKEVDAIT